MPMNSPTGAFLNDDEMRIDFLMGHTGFIAGRS